MAASVTPPPPRLRFKASEEMRPFAFSVSVQQRDSRAGVLCLRPGQGQECASHLAVTQSLPSE